jgi:hypothetical protein
MVSDAIKEVLLDLANEDWYGLYEIVWRLNALYPGEDESRKQEMAVHALSELICNGSVVIARLAESAMVLSQAEGLRVIQQPENWRPPSPADIAYGVGVA